MINKNIVYKHYCRESISLIENYDKAMADQEQSWAIHHRLETHKYKDRSRTEWIKRDEEVPAKELIALGLYYDRPAAELIFMTKSEHQSLHGSIRSEEWRNKISETLKGHPGANKGKHHSEVHKRKISEANRGKKKGPMSEEQKQKLSEIMKGKPGHACSEETKRKISETLKKRNSSLKR